MSLSPISLSGALHTEISRRADAWRDAIAEAVTDDRHRTIARAANDIAKWLMIGNELGWSQNQSLPQIELRGPIAQALTEDALWATPETHDDWRKCVKSAASTLATFRARCEDTPADGTTLRSLRAIHTAITAAHDRWLEKNPEPQSDELQEAA